MTRPDAPTPSTRTARTRNPSTRLLVLAGLGLLLIGLVDAINFTVDDTFISMRYAETFAAGNGLVYNIGERIEGYSNLLWTLLLAAFARAGINQHHSPLALLIAAKLMGAAFAIATLLVLAWLVYRIRRDQEWGDHTDLIALAVVCTSATYSFPAWSVSGLETPLCAFLVTLAGSLVVVALREFRAHGRPPSGRFLAAGVAFGLLTLVRPEQFFVWGLTFVVFFAVAPRALRPALVRCAIVTLVIAAGMFAWRWVYYGSLVPNSVTSKIGGGLFSTMLGIKYALAGFVSTLGIVALGFLGLPRLLRGRPDWQFLAIYCAAFGVFVLTSGGDWMPGFRFYAPLLPLLWVLAVASLLTFTSSTQPHVSPLAVCGLVLMLALASFTLGRSLVRAQQEFPTGFKGVTWNSSRARIRVAREVARMVPPGSLMAIFEAGCVPYFNMDLRIVDDSGLMDRTIARLPGRYMYKLTADYFLKRAPDYYLMLVRVGSPQADGVTLLASPEFNARYEVVRRIATVDLALEPRKGEWPIEEDLAFVLFRRRV